MPQGSTQTGRDRREEIIAFIMLYKDRHGVSPSLDEISEGIGVSRNSIFFHLGVLEDEGRISRTDGYRNISIIGELYFTPDKAGIWSKRIKGALKGQSDPLKLLNDLDRLFEAPA